MSVMVSGSGPSSRRLPASTNGTFAFTHSYRMPALQPAGFHRLRHRARVIDGVDGAHVVAVPVLLLPAVGQADAERGAEQRRLHIVHAQRVAAEQRRARSRSRISAARPATPPVCTTTGPATTTTFCFCSMAWRTSAAVWRTAVSTWRSDEMPLDMKANARRSRSLDSGITRMPRSPDHDPVALRADRAAGGRTRARRAPRSWRPCAGSPLRSTCCRGARGCGGWWWSRNPPARSGRARPSRSAASPVSTGAQPSSSRLCEQVLERTRRRAFPLSGADRTARCWCGRCGTAALRSGR